MGKQIFIEARPGESWRQVSRPFCEWLQDREHLEGFGIVEAPIKFAPNSPHALVLGFSLNDRNSKYAAHLKAWAAENGRCWGELSGNVLEMSSGESYEVVPEKEGRPPPWMS